MIKNEAAIVIARPIEQVFSFVADVEKRPSWHTGHLHTQPTSAPPIRVGTTFHEDFQLFLGRQGQADYEITEFEPNKRFSFKSISGFVQSQERMIFEPDASNTKITQVTEAQFGWLRFIEPFFRGMGQRMLVDNLSQLKEQLEG